MNFINFFFPSHFPSNTMARIMSVDELLHEWRIRPRKARPWRDGAYDPWLLPTNKQIYLTNKKLPAPDQTGIDNMLQLEQMATPWDPYPNLQEMLDLASNARTVDANILRDAFSSFLETASHEVWHQMLIKLTDKILARVEWELWNLTGRLIRIRIPLGKDVRDLIKLHNNAFTEAPAAAHLSFDVSIGVSRRQLIELVIKGVTMLVRKKHYVMRCREMLEPQQDDSRKDSRATGSEAGGESLG